MCGEKTLITPHHHGDNGAGQITEVKPMLAMNQPLRQCAIVTYLPAGGLSIFCCNLTLVCSRYDLLLDLIVLLERSFGKERLNILIRTEECLIKSNHGRQRKRGGG